MEALMSITEVSEYLGVPVATLYQWRHRGEGPIGIKVGRHVRYRRVAVEDFLDANADHRPAA
jgi:excisionase family DNA binding protein